MSASLLGEGEFFYKAVTGPGNWGRLPDGWLYGEVTAIGVDSKDQIYVFTRGEHPMIVFDREGNFLRSWGEGIFHNPHGLHIGPDDSVYCTDEGDHTVRKFTPHGKLLLQIGVPGKPAPLMSGVSFNRCTHTALGPDGTIYVADGYGNARVHMYTPDGKHVLSWGEPGNKAGQFNIVHNICCDCDGWVYVADRENHRVQVFDGKGRYETRWNDLHRPCGMWMESGKNPLAYVTELGPGREFSNRDWPNLGPRVSVLNNKGELLARIGDYGGAGHPSQFLGPHGIAVDSTGAIYVGEIPHTYARTRGQPVHSNVDMQCLQKLQRMPAKMS